jgi:hypothetical protein
MQLDAKTKMGIKGNKSQRRANAQIRRSDALRIPTPVDLLFLDLPSRPTYQFALAVRTNVLHFLRTMCAKGAFVRTNVGFAIH